MFTAYAFRYLTTQEQAMNTFYEHRKNSIKLAYRCFDRILLNGLIQPFQQPERVIGFFNAYRAGASGGVKIVKIGRFENRCRRE